VLGTIIVAWPVQVGWHDGDEIRAVLTKGFDQLDAGDFGYRVVRAG
jgi:hypothetical protein